MERLSEIQPGQLKAVFLQSTGRAGSMLFSSLLDSHPEIAMLARTTILHPHWKELQGHSAESLFIEFIKRFPYWFTGRATMKRDRYSCLGPKGNLTYHFQPAEVMERFCQLLTDELLSYTNVHLALHLAYYEAIQKHFFAGRPPETPRLIFHNVHGSYLDDYQAFDDPRIEKAILFLCKDPLSSMASNSVYNRDHESFERIRSLGTYFDLIARDNFECREHTEPGQLMTISKDVLFQQPERVMKQFCEFAKIRYEASLVESTVMGLQWWGNAKQEKAGIDRQASIRDLAESPSRTAKVFAPLIARRMVLRRIPRGVDSLGRSAWNLLRPTDEERALFRNVIVKTREEIATQSFWRRWSTSGRLLQRLVYCGWSYVRRVGLSYRFYRDYPEEHRIPELSDKTAYYRISSDDELIYQPYMAPTERLYSESEIQALVYYLADDAEAALKAGAFNRGARLLLHVSSLLPEDARVQALWASFSPYLASDSAVASVGL